MNNIISFLRDTKSIGDLSEMFVALQLARAGYLVAKPFGENTRYDLLIDDGKILSRVQVKTGRLRKGAIQWNCCSTHGHRTGPNFKSYIGQIDFFGIYCPQLQSAYLVPISQAPSRRTSSLRVVPTRNRQTRRVRWASDFLIGSEQIPDLVLVGARAIDGVSVPSPPAPS
jgi:PD-(D/E)XK nuclease superfamily protein